MFYLSEKSIKRLGGAHPLLIECVNLAIIKSKVDFFVGEGVRTVERQAELFNQRPKVTNTLKSMHLIQVDGYGHAVDLIPMPINGNIPWGDKEKFAEIKRAMFLSADELGLKIRWGGDWNRSGSWLDEVKRGSYDGPHFEMEAENGQG